MRKLFIGLFIIFSSVCFGQNGHDDQRYLNNTNFVVPTTMTTFGDSYTQGFRPDSPDTTFITRLSGASNYNLTLTNYGVSATGVWSATSLFNANINPTYTGLTSIMTGFNDLRRGNAQITNTKVLLGFNAMIANHLLKSWVKAGNGTNVTRSGTWTTTYTSSTFGGKSGSNGAYTGTLSDSIKYTFTDSTVVVGLFGADGTTNTFSNFDVYIDNILQGHYTENNLTDGISDGVNNNKEMPFVLVFRGLTNSAHSIKLINTSATSFFMVVDYFGHLKDASAASPILIWHVPTMDATGYAVSPSLGSAAATVVFNAELDSLCATWSQAYPIYVVKTENYFFPINCLASDHIHPSNYGDIQLTQAGLATLPQVVSNYFGIKIFAGTKRPIVINNNVRQELATTDDLLNPGYRSIGNFVQLNPVVAQGGYTNLTGAYQANTAALIGNSISPTVSGFSAGISTGGFPFQSFYRPGAGTDKKLWDTYTDDSSMYHRLVNDANSNIVFFDRIRRTVGFKMKSRVVLSPFYITDSVDGLEPYTAVAGENFMIRNYHAGLDAEVFGNGYARILLKDSSRATDHKIFQLTNNAGNFYITRVNDAVTANTYGFVMLDNGNSGVGSATPAATWDVEGTLKINDGSATTGYVWTATSSTGAGHWAAASGGGSPGGSTNDIQINGGSGTFIGGGPTYSAGGLINSKNQNASTHFDVLNTTAGASSASYIVVSSDINATYLQQYSSSTTASGAFISSSGGLITSGQHLVLSASNSSGQIDFAMGGSAHAAVYNMLGSTFQPSVNATNDLGTSSLGWRELFIGAGTSSIAQINLTAGTKKTSMAAGDMTYATGHLWFHDGSTDYDLLAAGSTPTLNSVLGAGATSSLAMSVGNFTSTGTLTFNSSSHATSFTVNSTDVVIYCTSGITVTLPTASSNTNRILYVKNLSAGNVTLSGMGSGEFTLMAAQGTTGASVTLQSNGTAWYGISMGQ